MHDLAASIGADVLISHPTAPSHIERKNAMADRHVGASGHAPTRTTHSVVRICSYEGGLTLPPLSSLLNDSPSPRRTLPRTHVTGYTVYVHCTDTDSSQPCDGSAAQEFARGSAPVPVGFATVRSRLRCS